MKMFRLTDKEEMNLREKCVEINKRLVQANREPLRDSELLHEILKECIERTEIGIEKTISII